MSVDLYYHCTPNSEAWLSVKDKLDKLNAMIKAGWAWGRKHGVPEQHQDPDHWPKSGKPKLVDTRMSYGESVCGFTAPGSDKTAWRCHEGIWVPNRGTRAGKALAKERRELPEAVDTMKWSDTLFKHGIVMGREEGSRGPGMLLRYASSGCKTITTASKGAGRPGGVTKKRLVVVIRMHTSVKKAAKHWPKGMVEITGSKADKLVG